MNMMPAFIYMKLLLCGNAMKTFQIIVPVQNVTMTAIEADKTFTVTDYISQASFNSTK